MSLQPIDLVFLAEDGTEIPPQHLTAEQAQIAMAHIRPWLDRAMRTVIAEPNLPGAVHEGMCRVFDYGRELSQRLLVLASFDTPRGRA